MLRLPWPWEPVPDHSTIHEAFGRMSESYLNRLLERSAELCVEMSGWFRGFVTADGTGVETDLMKLWRLNCRSLEKR